MRPYLRRLLVASLAAAALLCAIPAASHARVPRGFVGITADDLFAGNDNYRTATLGAQVATRVRLIRQTFHWRQIEVRPGVYNLDAYDAYVLRLAAHGIRVLPILFDSPSFYSGTTRTEPRFPPRSNIPMARFAQVLVRRYGPAGSLWAQHPASPKLAITAWQIWNEPSLPFFWRGRPNARSYARMVRTVGGAIRRAHRRAEIVTAGLPPSRLRRAVRLTRYIAQLYRARIGRSITSLAINPYARSQRELRRLLTSVRELMNRRGGRRHSIWITEIGWATAGSRRAVRLGTRGQARSITAAYRYIARQRRRLKIRGVVYFSWRDSPPYPPLYGDWWGLHTGLFDLDGSPKRGYYAFRRAVSRFR